MWLKIKMNKKNIVSLLLTVILLSLGVSVQGEQSYDIHDDPIVHGAIASSGRVDAMPLSAVSEGQEITINDKVYSLGNNCIFRNQFGSLVGFSSFRVGMFVKFFVINENEITKLWHADTEGDENDNDHHIDTDRTPASTEPFKKEGGVWTN